MKRTIRMLSALLALVMLIGVLPMAAMADDAVNAKVTATAVCYTSSAMTSAAGNYSSITINNKPEVTIDSSTFRSMGHASPFDGWNVSAAVAMTVCGGEIVHDELQEESV